MATEQQTRSIRFDVKNVGGIDKQELSFDPGVTLLVGQNATNRSSLMQAIMGVFGSHNVSLKTGADSGEVTMDVGGDTYTRSLKGDGQVVFGGEPYLQDQTAVRKAELFAFLMGNNEIRQAVRNEGDGLRELLLEPVDTATIQAEIDDLSAERTRLEREVDEAERANERLTDLIEEQQDLVETIEETEAERETVAEQMDEHELDLDTVREEQQELDGRLAKQDHLQEELDAIEERLATAQRSLEKTIEERDEVEAQLEAIEVATGRINEVSDEIDELRSQKNNLEQTLSNLESVVQFNMQLTDSAPDAVRLIGSAVGDDGEERRVERVTQELTGDQVTCWTCGSEVPMAAIDDTLDDLREFVQQKRSERNRIESDLTDLETELDDLTADRRTKQELEQRASELADRVDEREAKVKDLLEQKEDLEADVDEVNEDLEAIDLDETAEAFLEYHTELRRLEREQGRLETKLDNVKGQIEDLQEQVERIPDLEARVEELGAEIEERRTRIDRLEDEVIEQFNDHAEAIVERLDYENIARVWLEKKAEAFELNVVRQVDGVMHQDTVANLSESEREVTGLVIALAGYLAYDLSDDVPLVMLDSVESIDASRLAAFTEYLEQYAEFIIESLLPEDDDSMPDSYHRVYL